MSSSLRTSIFCVLRWESVLALVLCAGPGCERQVPEPLSTESDLVYEVRPPNSPEGSGKYYMGREIALVLDTPDTPGWLERPGREIEDLPGRVIQALNLSPDDVIADIGAGTGYFSFRFSPHVPEGKVFAVDIQEEMIGLIEERMQEENISNIEPVLGTFVDPNLPPGEVDVAIIILSYHEFSHPREMMTQIEEALKPGGRLVLVEYRGEDPTIAMSSVRRMTEDQAIKEMRVVGLRWVETKDILPQQHFMIFEKPVE